MKFALSALSIAMMTVTLMSASIVTHANTDTRVDPTAAPSHAGFQNEMPTITQIVEAEDSAARIQATDDIRIAHSAMSHDNKRATKPLSTLIDPITHKTVDNSYALDVSSFLSLEQAQDILLQVSPKIAANDAAIAASEYQTDALKTLDNPLVFARVSASAYHVDEDIDLSSLRSGIVNEINNSVDGIVPPPVPDLPNFGELVGERLPDSYDFKRSGETTSAGLGVAWPIYTAGRTAALTGASRARTQEALADSMLDKNALYNTLIERYFKAQLAIIAAYLRDDAYDTLKQTDHMAERLYEEGFISHVDRLEAQSALADAKSEAVKANNDARLAMIALQRLLRTDYRIKPTTPLFVSSRPLPDVSYFQDLALNNHPGLQKVAAKRAQAQQLHALSDTGYKPTVMLYGYGQVEKDPSWVAGISASWKLWGGLDKTASLASSSAQIRQADLSEIEVSDNLLLLVEKNWHDVNNAKHAIKPCRAM